MSMTAVSPAPSRLHVSGSAQRWIFMLLGAGLACGFWEITGQRQTFGTTWPALSDVVLSDFLLNPTSGNSPD